MDIVDVGKRSSASLSLKRRHPSLATLGIAVQHYPRYVNRQRRLHGLDVVLISFIVRGRGTHYLDEGQFTETGASLAVTHYGQRHDIVTDADGMEIINVYLDLQAHPLPALPAELQPVLPLLLPLHPRFVHRLNRIVRLQFDDPQPLARLLLGISDEIARQPPGYIEAVQLQWKLFLIGCCRQALARGFVSAAPPRDSSHARLETLRCHLDATYAEPHTLERLAKRARMGRTSLCRAFKAYTGKRLFDYLIERRIQAAMMALRQTDDKVLTVAMNCGFRDLAYFNRKFRQLTGVTPTAYRRKS
jgi:AraC-like DNA-binding protein